MFGRATIRLGIGPHSSSIYILSLFLFPRLISAVAEWMSTILLFYTCCCLSANLGCRSEMRCTRLAANTGRKHHHLGTIAQICRAISSQQSHVSTIGKKVLSSNTPSTCPDNMVNYTAHLTAEIGSGVWGIPPNFNGFRVLAALLHGTLVVGVSQTLRR